MSTFKELAYKILKETNKPLHSKQITKLAKEKYGLVSEGKTPEMTMNALLIVDINTHKEKSRFKKTAPSTFCINPNFKESPKKKERLEKQYPISKISSQQKGSIAEARIAELIILYGKTSLSCYKPISDDEGIDLIVKAKGSLKKTMYIQIKSRFDVNDKNYTATTKQTLINSYSMAMIFCYFDIEKGDIGERLWFVPAPDFIKKANKLKDERYHFGAGLRNPESGKWQDYLIDKRDLANKIVEQMEKISI